MRKLLLTFFIILFASESAIAEITCGGTMSLGCGAGCHWDAAQSKCDKCSNGYYTAVSSDPCKACTKAGPNEIYTGPGTGEDQCPTRQCPTHYGPNADHTACDVPKTYKIELANTNKICDFTPAPFYEKYDVGFSETENGPEWKSATEFKLSANSLPTTNCPNTNWYEFIGYFDPATHNKVIDENGQIDNDAIGMAGATYFEADRLITDNATPPPPLYTLWDGGEIEISDENAPGLVLNKCSIFDDNPTCRAPDDPTFPDGYVSEDCWWICKKGCIGQITINLGDDLFKGDYKARIDSSAIELQLHCSKKCPKGYFCKKGKQTPCPNGTTTDGDGKSTISDCHVTADTQFCDNDGCFSLPLGNNGNLNPFVQ